MKLVEKIVMLTTSIARRKHLEILRHGVPQDDKAGCDNRYAEETE